MKTDKPTRIQINAKLDLSGLGGFTTTALHLVSACKQLDKNDYITDGDTEVTGKITDELALRHLRVDQLPAQPVEQIHVSHTALRAQRHVDPRAQAAAEQTQQQHRHDQIVTHHGAERDTFNDDHARGG